ncbi:MAG: DsrE family protein [Armatimonadota bacterium]|nr:DsrE family protein [bacterium]MDW8321001.1 DsrE family protein [Armatimonadota bacterium]
MNILLIVNESPYGSERVWNALRLATALQQEVAGARIRIFLLSDGVYIAIPDHHRPEGSYNVGQMLASLAASGAEILACVTCIDQRGLWASNLVEGVQLGSMVELARWTAEAEKIMVF